MSLNTSIWDTIIPDSTVTIAPPRRVKVTVDGEDLGTAAEIVVNTQAFGEGNPSVDLKDLAGLANVSFFGHVYRDLRKTNKELEKKVHELTDRGVADGRGEDTAYWYRMWVVAVDDAARRREEAEQLTAEVERLKQSRREQAEKHKQKQANLQANFEQRAAGKTRSTNLKRQLESSQSYNEHLKQCLREKDVEIADLNAKLRKHSDEADAHASNLATQNLNLMGKANKAEASSAFWHEKFLESEERPALDAEAWQTAYKAQKEHSVARREALDRVTKERDQLLADINCFMEDFTEGATAINRAVEDWNEKADG